MINFRIRNNLKICSLLVQVLELDTLSFKQILKSINVYFFLKSNAICRNLWPKSQQAASTTGCSNIWPNFRLKIVCYCFDFDVPGYEITWCQIMMLLITCPTTTVTILKHNLIVLQLYFWL